MLTYKFEIQLDFFKSELLKPYFEPEDLCVFDIETLGLNPNINEVILASIFYVDENGNGQVTQFFADNVMEEKDLLLAIDKELKKYKTLLTYNGKHFDLPFVKKRAEILGLSNFKIEAYNLDLYLLINGHSQLKSILPRLKQVSIENYMGISRLRDDEITGKESIDLYYKYMDCINEDEKKELARQILLHNHDDVVQLYRLLPVIKQTDFHKGMNKLGFSIEGINGYETLTITSINLSKNQLNISGIYNGSGFSYIKYSTENEPLAIEFNLDNTFNLACPTYVLKGNIFINLRVFFEDDSDFTHLGGYVNGFLVLAEGDKKRNFLEINLLSKKLLEKFMLETEKNQ